MTRTTHKLRTTLFLGATMTSIGLAGAAAMASIAEPAPLAEPADPAAPKETKQLDGEITEISQDGSFVIKDGMNTTHTVTTNDKTRYSVDGEDAIREQVVRTGVDVEAKVDKNGLAVSVNRVTN